MAYIVNKSDGTVLTSVASGTIDNSYGGLILIGKLYSGYGEALNENLVRLLENSSKSTAPVNPLLGQLWFDSTAKTLKVCTYGGNTPTFKNISGCITSATTPTNSVDGDLWWDTTAKQLKVYDALTTSFVLIGPSSSAVTGQTGAIVASMKDTSFLPHYVIKEYVSDTVVAIVSKDAFTPAGTEPTNSNFPYIYAGYTLSNSVGFQYYGTASNASQLENYYANAFIRGNIATTTNGAVSFTSVDGISIGTSSDLKVSVTAPGNASITNQTASGLLSLKVKKSSTLFELITLDPTPASPTVTISSALTVNATSKFIGDVVPSVTGTYNLGNATTAFDTLYTNGIRAVGNGNVTLSSNTMPSGNSTIELGNSTFRFKSLYVDNLYAVAVTTAGGSTTLDNYTITNSDIATSVISNSQIVLANSISMAGSIIPNANTYTIGNGTRVFSTIYATNFGTTGTPVALAFVNNITPGSASNISLGGHITPAANATYNIGSTAARLVNVFSTNINSIGANITGNATIGNLTVTGAFGIVGSGFANSVTNGGGVTGFITGGGALTLGSTGSSSNGASTIVTRGADGSFVANIITAGGGFLDGTLRAVTQVVNGGSVTGTISGNVLTLGGGSGGGATSVVNASGINGSITGGVLTLDVNNGAFANSVTNGGGVTGTISGAGALTLGSNGASANGASTIVTRGSDGSFAANIVTVGGLLSSGANGTVAIGSAGTYFGNIFGTAMLARYADLAERYHADAVYESGTVVKLGGAHEVTQTVSSVDTSVFGVISTDPGLILNAGAGSDDTHPLIALTGRVPCKVTGTVNKGDRLVSSDIAGVAKAYSTGDDVLSIIGRALVNKTSTEVELIEIVVGVK